MFVFLVFGLTFDCGCTQCVSRTMSYFLCSMHPPYCDVVTRTKRVISLMWTCGQAALDVPLQRCHAVDETHFPF
eukprot:m.25499 g.25499  ORF g.25499 m.25499 type:complete len:74 (-) comp8727_c1_seq1:1091-1312(-)